MKKDLKEQIPSNWQEVNAIAINNQGHVAVIARGYSEKFNEDYRERILGSQNLLYGKDGIFVAVLPEKSPETDIAIRTIDDFGNMIVRISDKVVSDKEWFICPSEGYKAYIYNATEAILNKKPMRRRIFTRYAKKRFRREAVFQLWSRYTKVTDYKRTILFAFWKFRDRRSKL